MTERVGFAAEQRSLMKAEGDEALSLVGYDAAILDLGLPDGMACAC